MKGRAIVALILMLVALGAWVYLKYRDVLKAYFKDSETLLLAWAQGLFGALLAGLGSVDLTIVVADGLSSKQMIVIGLVAFINGIIQYYARKHRDPDME